MSIIDRIYKLFQDTNKTPAQLTRFLGVAGGQLANWRKRGTDPPARYIDGICRFFGVSAEYLLGMRGEEEMTPNERDLLNILNRFEDERNRTKFVGRVEAMADEMLKRAPEAAKKNVGAAS
jgi:transcriptional regulator with XRE-family HTH domain